MRSRRVSALAPLIACLVLTGCAGSTGAPQARVPASSASPAPASPTELQGSTGDQAATLPRWQPRVGVTWQWQLSGRLDTSVVAQVYDVDLFTTSRADVLRLRGLGRHVVCYLSAGSWEPGRPDTAAFPAAVRGRPLEGFADERWLDVRRTAVLLPLMAKRMDLCRAKGFAAVEADNVDGYDNRSGFPLTAADQLRYNRALAALAHQRGLSIALKNDLEQVPALVGVYDFAVNEQCVEYDECDALTPFIAAGKPVLHVEYALTPAQFCPVTRPLQFSSLAKREDLGAYRRTC